MSAEQTEKLKSWAQENEIETPAPVTPLPDTPAAWFSAKFPALAADDVAAEKRSQEIAQLRDYYAQLHRLDTVAFRIARANRHSVS